MNAPRQRLFVALLPAADQRRQLAAAAAALSHGGRAVAAGNLHLTLAFLGAVDAAGQRAAAAALQRVHGVPMVLDFDRVGHFPRQQVLWLAPGAEPPALRALHGAVGQALGAAGFALERRAFRPHVSVARKVARYRGPHTLRAPVAWRLDAVRLVASRTLPGGARYRVLRAVGLHAQGG